MAVSSQGMPSLVGHGPALPGEIIPANAQSEETIELDSLDGGVLASKTVAGRLSSMIERSLQLTDPMSGNGSGTTTRASKQERRADVETALAWLRREMALMRHQDQLLLKQFVDIHNGIHSLKRQQEYQLTPRSASDTSQLKAIREIKRSGAVRHDVTERRRASSFLQASLPSENSSDWSYVRALSQAHVDSFMKQVSGNMKAPRMQASPAQHERKQVLRLDADDGPSDDYSEC